MNRNGDFSKSDRCCETLDKAVCFACPCEDCILNFFYKDENLFLKMKNGRTPLHECMYNGTYFLLNEILSPKNINVQDSEGNTLLHEAIECSRDINIIKLLLNRGANSRIKNNEGNSSIDLIKLTLKNLKGNREWKNCHNLAYRDELFEIKKELMKKMI